jgi:hypothetical protein
MAKHIVIHGSLIIIIAFTPISIRRWVFVKVTINERSARRRAMASWNQPTSNKVGMYGCKLVEALVYFKHLSKCFMAIGTPPWFLDSSNVSRLGDR